LSARFALDTNVIVYAFTENPKREKARALLEAGPMISVQMLNEFANVASRKLGKNWASISLVLSDIRLLCSNVRPLDLDVHQTAMALLQRYSLSIYDALMIAAALLDGCEFFYSEHMQHGHVIDKRLTIINPFLDVQELT
jgi:predicted nucleic acid-binding protein